MRPPRTPTPTEDLRVAMGAMARQARVDDEEELDEVPVGEELDDDERSRTSAEFRPEQQQKRQFLKKYEKNI